MKITNQLAAIITGGASGLGAATARLLAELGVKITILDNKIKNSQYYAIACNVTDEQDVELAIKQANEHNGIARIFINCAGIAPAQRIISKQGAMPLADFKRVIDINLTGTFNCLRLAANAMLALSPIGDTKERGIIINTASIAAFEGQIGQAAYSAAKGGVCALTLPAAREFATIGIRVMSIAPGLMETPMLTTMPENVRQKLIAATQFPQRFGQANEFAQLVKHIIENAMLNGSTIRLDGAIRLG